MPTPPAAARERDPSPPRVSIVGGGFGGLRLARLLGRAGVPVTLFDQRNYHTFMPLLYEVATAGLSPSDITQPFRGLLRDAGDVRFVLARVEAVEPGQRRLITAAGAFPYEVLVLATGTVTADFGIAGVEQHSIGLKRIGDASAIRNRILRHFERASVCPDPRERARLMTVVVVGGGPTGVELAGALAELRQHVLRRDFPQLDMTDARVVLLEAGDELLPAFKPVLRRKARADLLAMGVDVRTRSAVSAASEAGVSLKDGAAIPTANIIWVAGTRGAPLARSLGVPLSRDGRLPVAATLAVEGLSGVYALGDIASLASTGGPPYPMLAQVAMQQADVVAANILHAVRGGPLETFTYHDRGIMATIGRRRAVAQVFGRTFSGVLAWLLWLAVHLLAIISLRNRALVLTNWVWNYFRYDRANRLLTDDDDSGA